MDKFIERLKELRLEKGKSLSELANDTGLSKGAIFFWESGQRIPNAKAIVILARYFHVSTDYLLGESDNY